MDLHRWIELDDSYRHDIALKNQLLNSDRRPDLFMHDDQVYDACLETLQLLIEHLPKQYPNMFERNRTKTMIINHITGESFNTTGDVHRIHPLEIAARLVQEDFAVLQLNPITDSYHAQVN